MWSKEETLSFRFALRQRCCGASTQIQPLWSINLISQWQTSTVHMCSVIGENNQSDTPATFEKTVKAKVILNVWQWLRCFTCESHQLNNFSMTSTKLTPRYVFTREQYWPLMFQLEHYNSAQTCTDLRHTCVLYTAFSCLSVRTKGRKEGKKSVVLTRSDLPFPSIILFGVRGIYRERNKQTGGQITCYMITAQTKSSAVRFQETTFALLLHTSACSISRHMICDDWCEEVWGKVRDSHTVSTCIQ